jgi:tellurite resistance protein TerC
VFVLIFSYFKTNQPFTHQHKILFWGLYGALIMSCLYFAGGFTRKVSLDDICLMILIYTGYKMLTKREKVIEPEKNPLIKIIRKLFP